MGKVLHASPVVPAGVAQMIETAEHSGRLGSVMESVGEYYESDGQRQLQELAKMLEPLIIITMGVIVAFVVASIMLPILDISSASNF
jgi:type II secretory pathway component PulF